MRSTLSWLAHPDVPGVHLYLCTGSTATHVDGQEAKSIALMRGAGADTSSKDNPQVPAFLKQIHVLDGPLKGR